MGLFCKTHWTPRAEGDSQAAHLPCRANTVMESRNARMSTSSPTSSGLSLGLRGGRQRARRRRYRSRRVCLEGSSRFPGLAAESFLYSIANVFTQQTFARPSSLHPLLDTLHQQGEAVSRVCPDQAVCSDWLPALVAFISSLHVGAYEQARAAAMQLDSLLQTVCHY
jgi:hypothetical protein